MFRFPPLTPFVKQVLIGTFGLFVVSLLVERTAELSLFALLALDPNLSFASLWQVLTHAFVYPAAPGSVLGIIIGLAFLWWIASPFEQRFGKRRTGELLVVSALAAGLSGLAAAQVIPATVQYGTGALILGLITAYARSLPPSSSVQFFGIMAVTPKQLVFVVMGLSALFALAAANYASLVADLGAIAAGWLYMNWIMRKPRTKKRKTSAPSPFQVIPGGGTVWGKNGQKWLN